MTELVETYK